MSGVLHIADKRRLNSLVPRIMSGEVFTWQIRNERNSLNLYAIGSTKEEIFVLCVTSYFDRNENNWLEIFREKWEGILRYLGKQGVPITTLQKSKKWQGEFIPRHIDRDY